jgi:predicted molibdopterin-dependent oxidoreductase YjgC
MLCAVQDLKGGNFLPACTTQAQPGMNIDTGSHEVKQFRKAAIEILLSEHRGDCEAPCRLVCPQYLNIPDFLLNLSRAGDCVEFAFNPSICEICGGRCEKACRRGRYDQPISIRDLLKGYGCKDTSIKENPGQVKKNYQHHFGKISKEEIQTLYFAGPTDVKYQNPQHKEAQRCLQCACSAQYNCQLRKAAFKVQARQHHFAAPNESRFKPIFAEKIIYFPDKCIRCNRCVELGKQLKPGNGPVMTGRGPKSVVSSSLNQNFAQAFAGFEEDFINECPTGALCSPKN